MVTKSNFMWYPAPEKCDSATQQNTILWTREMTFTRQFPFRTHFCPRRNPVQCQFN